MEPFVDVEAAARFLGVKVSYLYEKVRLRRIPSYKIGAFRRFRLSELETWVREQGQEGGTRAAEPIQVRPGSARDLLRAPQADRRKST